MDGEVDEGASPGALEANNQEEMPRIRIRSDLFSENRNANVVQNMTRMGQLPMPAGTDSEEEDEVEIVKVVEGNVCEEVERKEAREKTAFKELLLKPLGTSSRSRRLKPARKVFSEVLLHNQDNFDSSDFDLVLKVGSGGTHPRLPPSAPTSSSSQILGYAATKAQKAVGKGTRLVPVSYNNPLDLTITHFPPVYVVTAKEETCAKALVTEKNAELNRKHYNRSELPVKYTAAAMMARTLLDREVVKHIDQCFTRKGMKTSVKRGSYSKSRIVLGAEEDEAVEQDKEKRDQECQVVWASGAGKVSAGSKEKAEDVSSAKDKLKKVNNDQVQGSASVYIPVVHSHGISSERDLHRVFRQTAKRKREEKMKRVTKGLGTRSHLELDKGKALFVARNGKFFVDVAGLYSMSYDIEGISCHQKENKEQMKKVRVMLPKLASTLRGRLLIRYKQELNEILRAQRNKLSMPVID